MGNHRGYFRGALLFLALAVLCPAAGGPISDAVAEETYHLVIRGGRVVDPESGLDGVRQVGIIGGRVVALSEQPLRGRAVLDADGLVVAPGFIDLHVHGQDLKTSRYQVMDGVTTALDMEAGAYPVAPWYDSREGRSLNHYGVAVGHIPARVALKHGLEIGHLNTNPEWAKASTKFKEWAYEAVDDEQLTRLEALLEQGLEDGGLGLGLGIQYTPAASRAEIFRIFKLGARRGAPVFVHARFSGNQAEDGGVDAVQELLADAAASGASLHIVHVTSNGLGQTGTILDMVDGARARGLDVSVEAYPYPAASTYLQTAYFDPGWQQRYGISYQDLMWVATGERLTEATFESYRKQGGLVVIFMIPERIVELALRTPYVMVASDGLPFVTGQEHPRAAGTFARVLGRYVREQKLMSLTDALRKVSLMPAQRLEGYVPAMKRKGRIQVGADADIVVFDPDEIIDRATFEEPMQFSHGMVHVLVGGSVVVRAGALVEGVFPGQPVRRGRVPVD